MLSEEQPEYLGDCIYCGAPCYRIDGEFRSTTDMDCCCVPEGYEDYEEE